MKRSTRVMSALSVFALAFVGHAALAQSAVTIKINGYGGTDPAVVGDLINRFVKPAVAKDNINVVYEPLQGDYNKTLTTLLAAGNAGDVLYLPAETIAYVRAGIEAVERRLAFSEFGQWPGEKGTRPTTR